LRGIIVRGLPLDGREVITQLLEEEGDRIRHHGELGRFFDGGRAGAVKDCNDDDQSNGVGSGKLGRFAVFGDTAERVCGSDGDGGTDSLVGIKLELDFHCRGAMVRRENKLSMKKSSIGGKQYLAYLWELGELPDYIISGFGVL
jgi:hypothetical protein